jgi:hypothetical protein
MNRVRSVIAAVVLVSAGAALSAAAVRPLPFHANTAHYFVETDASQDFADDIGDFMEVMYGAYLKVFSNLKPIWEGPLRVRILNKREDYEEEVGPKLAWSGGVYRGRQLGILTCLGKGSPAGVKRVLQHEGFHQFFHKFIGGGATWVNEGLACYFGAGIIEGDKIRLGAVHAGTLKSVREAMNSAKALTLKELVLVTGSGWVENMNDKEKPPQYAQAMLLVHFLIHGMGGRHIPVLNKYLLLQKSGVRGEEALVQAFGTDFVTFDKKWREYILQLKPFEPPSCTRNLERLAMLLQFGRRTTGIPEGIGGLHELAVAGRITGWKITLPDGQIVTPTDAGEIEKWFHCPEVKYSTMIPYELAPTQSETGLPDIVCTHHGRYVLRAHIQSRPDGKGTYTDIEQERLTARKPVKR